MAFTDSLVDIGDALDVYLNLGKSTLGLQDVWYDITGLVPRTPAILIEPDNKLRELVATGHQTLNTFNVGIVIIHSRMASNSVTNKECLTLAESVESYLHQNRTLGGRLIHSYVVSTEQGTVTQQKVLLRATQLMWQGISKTRI
jgi:hypothetical protein